MVSAYLKGTPLGRTSCRAIRRSDVKACLEDVARKAPVMSNRLLQLIRIAPPIIAGTVPVTARFDRFAHLPERAAALKAWGAHVEALVASKPEGSTEGAAADRHSARPGFSRAVS
jgi:hypothetical protein